MKNNWKNEWEWMNAVSGLLGGAVLSLGLVNLASGKLPREIDLMPWLPWMALISLVGAFLGGAARMRPPADMKLLNYLAEYLRGVAVLLVIAFFIALAILAIQYEASHPPPPGWEGVD